MGILTFDRGQIAYMGSPLTTPWWVAANVGLTIVIFYWIIAPILYVRRSRSCFCFFLLPPQFSHHFVAVHECLVLLLPSLGVITLLR